MLPGNWDELPIASRTELVPSLLAVKAKEGIWQVSGFSVHIQGSLCIRVPLSFHFGHFLYHMPSECTSECRSALGGLIQLRKEDLPWLG